MGFRGSTSIHISNITINSKDTCLLPTHLGGTWLRSGEVDVRVLHGEEGGGRIRMSWSVRASVSQVSGWP